MRRRWTRRQLLQGLLAATPLLSGCTISGSVQQRQAQQLANATASPTPGATAPAAAAAAGTPPAGTVFPHPSPQATFTPDGQAELRFGAAGSAEELDAYAGVVGAYAAATPKTKVTLERLAGNGVAALAQGFAAGTAPDVVTVPWDRLAAWSDRGVLDDLTALLGGNALDTSGQFTPLPAFTTLGGHTEALALSYNPRVLYINMDLFDAAGLKAPGVGFDWQAFEAAAGHLSQGATHAGFASTTDPFDWAPWVWAAGGSVFDDELTPSACTLTDAAAVSGLQRFADLWGQHKGAAAPGSTGYGSSPLDGFVNGKVAMVMGDRSALAALKAATFKWQVTYLPQGPGGYATTYVATIGAVTRSSRQPLAASSFLGFLATGQATQTALARTGIVVPALRAAAESADFKYTGAAIDDAVYRDTLLFAEQPPRTSAWTQVQAAWKPDLDKLWSGGQSAADAAKALAPKVNAALKAQAATPPAQPFAIQPLPTAAPTPPPVASPTARTAAGTTTSRAASPAVTTTSPAAGPTASAAPTPPATASPAAK